MSKKLETPKLTPGGLTLEIYVNRYRIGSFEAAAEALLPKFPGLKVVKGHDPLEGKTPLDFLPDPPPSGLYYTVTAPYPVYKVGDYTLRGIITDRGGKRTIWTVEEGTFDRETVEGADFLLCHHCNTRRHRNTLYFFSKDGEKELTQIGSTCAKDYLGVDVEKELRHFGRELALGFKDEEDWGFGGGSRGPSGFDFGWIVPLCIVIEEKSGYLSKTKAEEQCKHSTADWVQVIIDRPTTSDPRDLQEERARLQEEAHARKDALLEEAAKYRTQIEAELERKWTEFKHNLVQNFQYTTLGFAAFIASDIIKRRAKASQKGFPQSKCLDAPISTKQADIGIFQVTFLQEKDGFYGVTYFHVAKAEDGTTVFFNRSVNGLKVGDKIALRGKVKKHLADATVIGCAKPKLVK